jgi:3-oxoacyl-[acyl-carrier protein] reductase
MSKADAKLSANQKNSQHGEAGNTMRIAKGIFDRVALITGANRGLGLELAKKLVRDKWDVAVTGRDVAHLKAVYAEEKVPVVGAFELKLTEGSTPLDQIQKMIDSIPNLGLVVHNASPYMTKSFLKTSAKEFEDYSQCMLRDNLIAHASLLKLSQYPKGGLLVITGAVIGVPGFYNRGLMGMVKANQRVLAGVCETEGKPLNVKVKHLTLGSFADKVDQKDLDKVMTAVSVADTTAAVIADPDQYPHDIVIISKANEKDYNLKPTPFPTVKAATATACAL